MANLVSVIGKINHEAVSFKDSVCAWALRMAVCGWILGLRVETGRYPSGVGGNIETALESIGPVCSVVLLATTDVSVVKNSI